MSRGITRVAVMVVGLCATSFTTADERDAWSSVRKVRESTRTFPGLTLPIDTFGSVSVRNDGRLVVHVQTNDAKEWQSYVFQAPEGATLEKWGKTHFFNDSQHNQSKELGAEDKDLETTEFVDDKTFADEYSGTSEDCEHCVPMLLTVWGDVKIWRHPETQRYHIRAYDRMDGQTFETEFRLAGPILVEEQVKEEGKARDTSCSACTNRGCCCHGKQCALSQNGKVVSCKDGACETTCTDSSDDDSCNCTTNNCTVAPIHLGP